MSVRRLDFHGRDGQGGGFLAAAAGRYVSRAAVRGKVDGLSGGLAVELKAQREEGAVFIGCPETFSASPSSASSFFSSSSSSSAPFSSSPPSSSSPSASSPSSSSSHSRPRRESS